MKYQKLVPVLILLLIIALGIWWATEDTDVTANDQVSVSVEPDSSEMAGVAASRQNHAGLSDPLYPQSDDNVTDSLAEEERSFSLESGLHEFAQAIASNPDLSSEDIDIAAQIIAHLETSSGVEQ